MAENHADGYVKAQNAHGVMTIEFFHPKSNSLPAALLKDLAQKIHRANTPDTKVIVLRSAGEGAFCAGASFDELNQITDQTQGFEFFMGFARVINEIRKSDKIVIARVHGKCVGGGVGIASAADYAIAHEQAEVRLSELAIGIGPFVIGPAVQRKIGLSAFSQLAIDAGMWRSSQWAKIKGLFAEVHPTIESMDESIMKLSASLSKHSTAAMAGLKGVLWEGCETWDTLLAERARISGELILGEEAQESLRRIKKAQESRQE